MIYQTNKAYTMDEIEKMFPTSKTCPYCKGTGHTPSKWKIEKKPNENE